MVPCIGRWILNHCATREVPWILTLTSARCGQCGPSTWLSQDCRQAAWMLTPSLDWPKWVSRGDSEPMSWPGLGQTGSMDPHLNFSHTLGGEYGHSPQALARPWVESSVDSSSVPVMLTEPGIPLRFEGANPSPTIQVQTYFSTNAWGPRSSSYHCRTRGGHPGTQSPD